MLCDDAGLIDFVSSVASSVDAVLVAIELIRLPFISILGVLKVIIPSDSARLHDIKLMGFSDRSSSSTTINVDLHFLSFQCVCVFVRCLILLGTWFSRITLASTPVSIMAWIWHPSSVILVKFNFCCVCVFYCGSTNDC